MSWRAIQDSAPHSETLAAVSSDARSLFWNLLAVTDAWGRGYGSPVKVRARAVPLFGWELPFVGEKLEELVSVGRIVLYSDDGALIFQLVDFDEHQPSDLKRKRGPSRFADPPAEAIKAARSAAAQIRTDSALGRPRAVKSKPRVEKEKTSLQANVSLGTGGAAVLARFEHLFECPAKLRAEQRARFEGIVQTLGEDEAIRLLEERHQQGAAPQSLAFFLPAFEEREVELHGEPARPRRRRTGWTEKRGTHGLTYVRDPDGVDAIPPGYQVAG